MGVCSHQTAVADLPDFPDTSGAPRNAIHRIDPTPLRGTSVSVVFRLTAKPLAGAVTWRIYTVHGRLVRELPPVHYSHQPGRESLEIGPLERGVYLLAMAGPPGGQILASAKMVVVR